MLTTVVEDRPTPPNDAAPQDAPDVDSRLFVAGVSKAMAVLRAFQETSGPQGLTEVARRTGIGRSAAQRFLYTLRVLGYLQQDPRSKRFTLTPKVIDFTNAYLRSEALVSKAFPYLLEASKQTDETVNLTRLDGGDVVFLSRFPSRKVITADLVIGSRLPAFCTALGRCMLAYLPQPQVDHVLDDYPRRIRTPYTVVDRDAILARLETIRLHGYDIALQEALPGDLSVAAPIFAGDDDVVAAVNVAVPTPRWSREMARERLAPVVVETARAISSVLERPERES